jgi:hypothetical protein
MQSPQMTTTSRTPQFEQPDIVLSEQALIDILSRPINYENFNPMMSANYMAIMAARDRKLTRSMFEEVLVNSYNFQNRLVRIAELGTMLEHLYAGEGFGTTDLKTSMARHLELASGQQDTIVATLKLFQHMRAPGEPVS